MTCPHVSTPAMLSEWLCDGCERHKPSKAFIGSKLCSFSVKTTHLDTNCEDISADNRTDISRNHFSCLTTTASKVDHLGTHSLQRDLENLVTILI
ncbi:unnamed protein product, partial [Oppiella nova]